MHKILWDFEIQTVHIISARWPYLVIVNNKKRTYQIVDFTILADQRVKLKESKKKDKYLDLAWELKEIRNMKVMVIPTVISALRTTPKRLVKGLEDLKIREQVKTTQTTPLLRSARILGRVLVTCCHSNSSEIPSTNFGVKKLSRSNNNNNNNNIKTTTLLRLARILREVLKTWGDLLPLKL